MREARIREGGLAVPVIVFCRWRVIEGRCGWGEPGALKAFAGNREHMVDQGGFAGAEANAFSFRRAA